jgi:transposase
MSAMGQEASNDVLLARVAMLEGEISAQRSALSAERAALSVSQALVEQLKKDVEILRASHERLRQELEMLRRRLFVAKAERIDSEQLKFEFERKLAELDELARRLPPDEPSAGGPNAETPQSTADEGQSDGKEKRKPSGRRDLRGLKLPEERIEIPDPVLEALVEAGKAERIGFEESYKLGWKRGGQRRIVIARVSYRAGEKDVDPVCATAPVPPEALPRAIAAPSMLAHIIHEKLGRGMPLYRIETGFRRDGVPIDRGTMSRWMEELGALAGTTIIEAARADALATAFCISTDATGIAIQPERVPERKRQACRRGHFFVQIADRDHVFFEYTAEETSNAVAGMFRGFKGYVQADAKSVFDILFRPAPDANADDEAANKEVGCWAHARRKLWEAAVATKSAAAREGLYRIGRIYDLEAQWRDKPPDEITRLRQARSRPEVEAFFTWVDAQHELVRAERGLLRRAFGYAVRQKEALMRFLDDGRLKPDNNASERELRQIAVGRKAWLFVGSDDHATSTGNLLSLIASARLHGLDPEDYLRDVIRVLPHWPKDRSLELAPKYWSGTRAQLDPKQLAADFGVLTLPDPPTAAQEPPAS